MAEMDQLLGHADDNDGIDEYDNPLPVWWQAMFVLCVLWAIGYAVNYHFIAGHSQVGFYEAEMAEAAIKWPKKDAAEVAAAAAADPGAAEAGKQIYMTNCVACHGGNMEGGIGPNLTDDEWIHGSTMEDIIRTITVGVPEKGMLTWGPILGDEKIAQVAAYVHGAGGGVSGKSESKGKAKNKNKNP